MTNFEDTEIELTYFSEAWGPFLFHIPSATSPGVNDGLIPYDVAIISLVVKVYLGDVKKGTPLSSYEEITDKVLPTGKLPSFEDNLVRAYFNYPGDSYSGKRATLVLECGLSNMAKQAFFFNSITVS